MSGVRTEELDYASAPPGSKYNGLRRAVKTPKGTRITPRHPSALGLRSAAPAGSGRR